METSDIDPSEPPLPLVSCQDIREQEKRGKKSNVTIKHDDPRMIHPRDHFDYLHKFGEVKAVKVIATVVDGARGLAK